MSHHANLCYEYYDMTCHMPCWLGRLTLGYTMLCHTFYDVMWCMIHNSLPDPPNNTSVSLPGPVLEDDSVTLTCSSNANPSVDSYTWYRVDGDQVTAVGSRKRFTTKATEDNSHFYCEARNMYGTQNSSVIQIDVQCKSDGGMKRWRTCITVI